MTDTLATALHAMVPAFEGETGDWGRVRRDAGRRGRKPAGRRRLVLGAALAFALLLVVPLGVVGSSRDWWFFAHGEHPKPATPVAVVESGTWAGQRWTLTAFRNKRGNICYSVNAGKASAITCADTEGNAFLGFVEVTPQRPSLRWFAAVTKASVDHVALRYADGQVLRSPTVAGPPSLKFGGRFFVIRQPDDPAIKLAQIGGYARGGALIACVDMANHRINAPLELCRR